MRNDQLLVSCTGLTRDPCSLDEEQSAVSLSAVEFRIGRESEDSDHGLVWCRPVIALAGSPGLQGVFKNPLVRGCPSSRACEGSASGARRDASDCVLPLWLLSNITEINGAD